MTTNTVLTETHDMVVVHRVFRRELHSLPALVRGVSAGDQERARLIAAHLDLVVSGLHEHHTGEDELLWPLLLDRVSLETEFVTRMEMQHEVIADALDQVNEAARQWRIDATTRHRDVLAEALARTSTALAEHLDDEEQLILPLAARHLTQAEWDRLAERARRATQPGRIALLNLGLLLEEVTAEERQWLLAGLPRPVRMLWNVLGQRLYDRYITRVRAGHIPPTAAA